MKLKKKLTKKKSKQNNDGHNWNKKKIKDNSWFWLGWHVFKGEEREKI
jgi:hypothetical protein